MIRLYYNGDPGEPPWIVEAEGETHKVRLVGVSATGISCFDPNADNKTAPKAWIEFPEARISLSGRDRVFILDR